MDIMYMTGTLWSNAGSTLAELASMQASLSKTEGIKATMD